MNLLDLASKLRALADEIDPPDSVIHISRWTGLLERPSEFTPGWQDVDVQTPIGNFKVKSFTDPSGNKWMDYAPAAPGKDSYWIRRGVYDLTARVWNAEWINHDADEELQDWFEANYKGGHRE